MEIVVSVKPGADIPTIEKQMGLKLRKNSPMTQTIYLAEVEEDVFEKTIGALNASPLVVAAEKNAGGYTILEEAV